MSPNHPSANDSRLKLEIDRIDLLYRQNIWGLAALILFCASYLLVGWRTESRSFLVVWGSLVALSGLIRLLLTVAWKKTKTSVKTVRQAQLWGRAAELFLLSSGLAWAAIGWQIPHQPSHLQLVTLITVMVMSAGAISAYSASFAAMMVVLLPAISFTSISLIRTDSTMLNWAGWLILAGAILGAVVGKNLSRYILHSLQLSVQNSQLVDELAREVAKLEEAQRDLHKNEGLRRERSEHEAANRAKSILLANASHEIRTPLAAINGFAAMILSNPKLEPELRDDLKMVLRNGKYLVSLVNDLIDLSKLESDQIYIQTGSVDPVSEMNEVIALLQPQFSAKGLSISFEVQGELPKKIETDSTRLREILINLLTNAYKFTDRGTISIRARFDSLAQIMTFAVTDTGIGIDPQAAKQLFQPFSRGDSVRVQRTEGSGLGLALSRRLAKLLGGDLVLAASDYGRGSTFELTIATGGTLEASEQPRLSAPAGSVALQSIPVSEKALFGRKILVVDDAPDLQILMRRFLEKQGAIIEIRSNGQEAIDCTEHQQYDLILMDIKMPVMDGYVAANLIRKNGYKSPMIAVTAHASADDRQRCYQNGFDAYISKPVDFEHLVDDLAKHLPTIH